MDRDVARVREHYAAGQEADRLDSAVGMVEFERTKEILLRALPQPPATIADVGGGPGRYSTWLAASGHEVILTDVVPRHVEEAYEAAARAGVRIKAGWATHARWGWETKRPTPSSCWDPCTI
jgi:2-polyprenyl-3-methyl-5-hydroxy-6-metoxy-1,4-benzoquinol methylase